jgi:hypothetical protein
MFSIKGAVSKVEIRASTYDAIRAAAPMCEHVTKQCVNAKDQVFDLFLAQIAPTLKSAELVAESNARTSCLTNISECFRKACTDNMDPNNQEESFDACIAYPDNFRGLCKVQIDPCEAAIPNIMAFVKARLAAMRVDGCTRTLKSCLSDDNACGPDFSGCLGLDTDSIVRLCPRDKLALACTETEGTGKKARTTRELDDYLAEVAQGIMLSIDNNHIAQCQAAADAAMIKVCGSTTDCNQQLKMESVQARWNIKSAK